MNSNILANALVLQKAARILNDDSYRALAWRQLDWALGLNPFNASTVIGVGVNQIALFIPGAYNPPTPAINGGVMNGIGGDDGDMPFVFSSGNYRTGEYWTPHNLFFPWLIADLLATAPAQNNGPAAPSAPQNFRLR
jgi:hypothetical protein